MRPERYYTLVVMTYCRPQGLKECLISLTNQELGTECFEVLVIDDGSDNDNLSIVQAFQNKIHVQYLKQNHRGISAARNTGWREAKGNFVGFIADDYRLPPNYLTTMDIFFNKLPSAEVITCNIRSAGRGFSKHVLQLYKELALFRKIETPFEEDVIASFRLAASRAAIFKKETLIRMGGFNESLTGGEDADLTLRLSKSGIPVYFLPKFYIEHWENKSLLQFLDQRFRYGWYSFDIADYELRKRISNMHFRFLRLFFFELSKDTLRYFIDFLQVSRKCRKLSVFILFSPLILLNLIFYSLGYFCNAWQSKTK